MTENERTGTETPSPSEVIGSPASVEMEAEDARQMMSMLSSRRRLTGVGATLQRAADTLESVGVVDEAPTVSVTDPGTRDGSLWDALYLVDSLSDGEWSERNDRMADELGVDEAMPDRPDPERVGRVKAGLVDLLGGDTTGDEEIRFDDAVDLASDVGDTPSDAEVHGPLDDAVDLVSDLVAVRAEEHEVLFEEMTAEGNPLEEAVREAERDRAAKLAQLGVDIGESATDHVAAEGLTGVVAADLDGDGSTVDDEVPERGL